MLSSFSFSSALELCQTGEKEIQVADPLGNNASEGLSWDKEDSASILVHFFLYMLYMLTAAVLLC